MPIVADTRIKRTLPEQLKFNLDFFLLCSNVGRHEQAQECLDRLYGLVENMEKEASPCSDG